MNRYRDPSFDFTTIRTVTCAQSIALPALRVALAADYVSDEQYESWVGEWKQMYKNLSNVILEVKNCRRENKNDPAYAVALDSLRRVANTLLNARQYAKDRRKSFLAAA